MARFRYRGRRRFGKRRFYRRKRYGRKQRIINASSRSRCRVKIRCSRFLQFQVTSTSHSSGGVLAINPYIEQNQESAILGSVPVPRYTSCVMHQIFQQYKKLYEEFKLDYMKVQIMGITPVGAAATLPGVTFTTAWDRRTSAGELGDPHYPTVEVLNESPSCQQTTAINNSVVKFKRMIRPSDLLEKLAWYPVDTRTDATAKLANATNVACSCLSFYGVNSTLPMSFAPTFFMVLTTPSSPAQGTTYDYKFRVEITYYVTFRNPRFGQSSSSGSKSMPQADGAAPMDGSDDDEGDDDASAPPGDFGNNPDLRHVRFDRDESDSGSDDDDDNNTRRDSEARDAGSDEEPTVSYGAATAAAATARLPREVDLTGSPELMPSKRPDVQDLELEEHYADMGIPERQRQHADRDQIEYEGAVFLNALEKEMDRGVGKDHHWAVPERLQPLFMVVRDWLARRNRLIEAGVSGDIATQQAYYDVKDRWPSNIPRGLAQRLANFFINRALLYRKNYDSDAVRYISPRGTFIRTMEDQISESLYQSLLRRQREEHYLPPALRRASATKVAPPPWKQRKR